MKAVMPTAPDRDCRRSRVSPSADSSIWPMNICEARNAARRANRFARARRSTRWRLIPFHCSICITSTRLEKVTR